MPEYIIVWRFRADAAVRDVVKWRTDGKVFTDKHLAETEAEMLNEEFPNCEYKVATIE